MVGAQTGVLMSIRGGVYRVHSGSMVIDASVRGKLKQQRRTQLVVGDRIVLACQEDGSYTIEDREGRRNELRRRTPGGARGTRIVAANIDQILVVASLRNPDWDFQLIDRFLAVAEANHIPAVLVVNKIDLEGDPAEVVDLYRHAGYRVLLSSVRNDIGIGDLRAVVRKKISVFTGSTGVGKSSLVQAIEPGLTLRIGEVSERAKVGRHTTVGAEMFPLTGGGFLVDTPGLRDVGLWALEPAEVVAAFPEFSVYSGQCRFDDCRHVEEPSCAVVAALHAGEIAGSRLTSYRRFLDEAKQASKHWE